RRFGSVVEDQRHTITSGYGDEATLCFRGAKMFGLAHYLIKQLQQSPLLVRYELRITDDVDEDHINDLQFDLFFNLYRHPLMLPKNQPIDNLILRGPWRAQLALREMVADQDEQLAHTRLIHVFVFE